MATKCGSQIKRNLCKMIRNLEGKIMTIEVNKELGQSIPPLRTMMSSSVVSEDIGNRIPFKSKEEHIKHLHDVVKLIVQHEIILREKKIFFILNEFDFLDINIKNGVENSNLISLRIYENFQIKFLKLNVYKDF